MLRPPKGKDETFFSGGGGRRVAIGGICFGAATLAGYAIGNVTDYKTACTMAYLILSLSQLLYVLEMRNNVGLFKGGITPFMTMSVILSVALVAVVAVVPLFQTVFGLTFMKWYMYVIAVVLSALPTIVHEIWRIAARIKRAKRNKTAERKKLRA